MNKLIVLISFVLNMNLLAEDIKLKQFPDDSKVYRPGVDSGFDIYKTKSLFNSNKVVLTFDDGPHVTNTPKVLDLLKEYNYKATFFILTENVNEKTLPIIERMIREGHVIASHHHNHKNNNSKNKDDYSKELLETVLKIKQLNDLYGARNELYYIFPYGEYGSGKLDYHHFNIMKDVSNSLFGENCINFAFWDIDSLDWLQPMSETDIVSNIMAHLKGGRAYDMKKSKITGKYKKEGYTISRPIGGGVVLMHDIHEKSVRALAKLLPVLARSEFSVVALNEVNEFKYQDKSCTLK